MKCRNTAIYLAMLLSAVLLTGCGKEETPAVSQSDSTSKAQAANDAEPTSPPRQGKHHITVETVEISAADLKAQDYTVPVYVNLDKNAGVTYAEWGLAFDERCTFAVETKPEEPLALSVYFSENPEAHFLWTAWASGSQPNDSTGPIMIVNVTLPKDAAAGDFYTVDYADWSLADKGHAWSNAESDWAALDEVTWVDGGIKVVE